MKAPRSNRKSMAPASFPHARELLDGENYQVVARCSTIQYTICLPFTTFYSTEQCTEPEAVGEIILDSIRSDPIQSTHSFKMKCDSELSDIRASLLGQSRERCRRSNSIPTHRYPLKAVARLTIQSDSPLVSLIVIGASQV